MIATLHWLVLYGPFDAVHYRPSTEEQRMVAERHRNQLRIEAYRGKLAERKAK